MKVMQTKSQVLLISNGQCINSVDKKDIEDFTSRVIKENGIIDFQTKSELPIRFAFPNNEQFDEAIQELILITDEMGI